MDPKHKNKKKIICRCNNISEDTILKAIEQGCTTLNEIFDATTAGVGACGGTCRVKIKPLLENAKKKKETPESND